MHRHVATLAVSVSAAVFLSLAAACGTGSGSTSAGASDKPLVIVHGKRAGGLHGTLVNDPPLPKPLGTFTTTADAPFRFADASSQQVTVLYFGFTHCDDVCPTTMADLATARRLLPPNIRSKVRVAFLTVDPARDTPPVLREWLDRFDSNFVGLRGGAAEVHAAERSLYADASSIDKTPTSGKRHKAKHGESPYQVNHTGSVYVFGPGDRSVVYTGGTLPSEYAADFQRLLQGSGG